MGNGLMETQKIKTLTGVVTSNSGKKSIRVTIDYKVWQVHPAPDEAGRPR
jgi:ribosomal protein S17